MFDKAFGFGVIDVLIVQTVFKRVRRQKMATAKWLTCPTEIGPCKCFLDRFEEGAITWGRSLAIFSLGKVMEMMKSPAGTQ